MYRKAKKDEISCSKCYWHKRPEWWGKQIRCTWPGPRYQTGYAVSKNNTCERAHIEGEE